MGEDWDFKIWGGDMWGYMDGLRSVICKIF